MRTPYELLKYLAVYGRRNPTIEFRSSYSSFATRFEGAKKVFRMFTNFGVVGGVIGFTFAAWLAGHREKGPYLPSSCPPKFSDEPVKLNDVNLMRLLQVGKNHMCQMQFDLAIEVFSDIVNTSDEKSQYYREAVLYKYYVYEAKKLLNDPKFASNPLDILPSTWRQNYTSATYTLRYGICDKKVPVVLAALAKGARIDSELYSQPLERSVKQHGWLYMASPLSYFYETRLQKHKPEIYGRDALHLAAQEGFLEGCEILVGHLKANSQN